MAEIFKFKLSAKEVVRQFDFGKPFQHFSYAVLADVNYAAYNKIFKSNNVTNICYYLTRVINNKIGLLIDEFAKKGYRCTQHGDWQNKTLSFYSDFLSLPTDIKLKLVDNNFNYCVNRLCFYQSSKLEILYGL